MSQGPSLARIVAQHSPSHQTPTCAHTILVLASGHGLYAGLCSNHRNLFRQTPSHAISESDNHSLTSIARGLASSPHRSYPSGCAHIHTRIFIIYTDLSSQRLLCTLRPNSQHHDAVHFSLRRPHDTQSFRRRPRHHKQCSYPAILQALSHTPPHTLPKVDHPPTCQSLPSRSTTLKAHTRSQGSTHFYFALVAY